jgi:hypothetical protein
MKLHGGSSCRYDQACAGLEIAVQEKSSPQTRDRLQRELRKAQLSEPSGSQLLRALAGLTAWFAAGPVPPVPAGKTTSYGTLVANRINGGSRTKGTQG